MLNTAEKDEVIRSIGIYASRHVASAYEISFEEGDSYRCRYSTDDYEDNDEELDSPGYEEWYAIDFKVVETVHAGPNKDPRFEYITISRKRMPSLVACDGEIVFQME